jgi:tRNA1(Val) A37 N6-methylase TrmN6
LECPEVIEYVGTDVIQDVCEKTIQFSKKQYPDKITKIFCQPSENLGKSKSFKTKYREHFDVVFFSPPYYKLELYDSKNQSTDEYKTYEEWLQKYWEETIKLCHYVLEKNGKLCYILSGYGSQNTDEQYDLLKDMNNITKKYFKLKSQQPMYNKDVHVTKHKETSEKIMIFVK